MTELGSVDEAKQRSRGLLLPACVGIGSVALLATAGPLPALYLAVGGAGGWFIGKRLRGGGKEEPPEGFDEEEADSDDDSDEDESEENEEEAMMRRMEEEAAGAAAVAPYLFGFLGQLRAEDAASSLPDGKTYSPPDDPAAADDRAIVEAGMHEVFSQIPRERLDEIMQAFVPSQRPPSAEDVQALKAAAAEITDRLPPAAAAAMER
eukprot:CAMPEP_0171194564 /NCGR_PEP_ID=MMETSP0790-20130122/20953_1 /TAXON_ID=2925 /ORGANISM="Alexandrium catenella, Strain OF101" /LENGTH=206 /DNA_ID=CAMNT_0011659763 /DNA_START=42 /DNA_END=659 /DNA_ORIENTATION=+